MDKRGTNQKSIVLASFFLYSDMADYEFDEDEGIPPFPPEVLEKIFCYLDGQTVARAFSVCRQWNCILESMARG